MSIRTALSRRRNEKRIRMRTHSSILKQNNPDPNGELEAKIENYQNRAYSIGNKMYQSTQNRKAEGKQILKNSIKHGIGVTARAFLGSKSSSNSKKSKSKTSVKAPSFNKKLVKKVRRK